MDCCWKVLSWSHIILGSETRSEPSWSYWKQWNISCLAKKRTSRTGELEGHTWSQVLCGHWGNTSTLLLAVLQYITASQPVDVYFHHTDTRRRSATLSSKRGTGGNCGRTSQIYLVAWDRTRRALGTEMCALDQQNAEWEACQLHYGEEFGTRKSWGGQLCQTMS